MTTSVSVQNLEQVNPGIDLGAEFFNVIFECKQRVISDP